MPTNIIETPSKGDTLSVPVGTDKRKASSLTAAWQAIGNRLAYLEQLDVFRVGGALTLAADFLYTIAAATHLEFGGDGSARFSCTNVYFDRNIRGPVFEEGSSGRAPLKYAAVDVAGTVDATATDTLKCNPSANIILTLANVTYVKGDFLEVYNWGAFTVQLNHPTGGTQIIICQAAVGGWPSHAIVVYNGSVWTALTTENGNS